MGRLENKVALITGAAMGMGEADARLFAKEEAKVVVADIKEVEGEKVAEDIRRDGREAIFVKLDVSEESDWKGVMTQVIKKYGKLNILVNNAGIIIPKGTEETSLDEWNRVMAVNSTGVFLGTKYAIGTMKSNGEQCSIINRSSDAAMIGVGGMAAYSASKGAVRAFTKSAALDCAKRGYTIRVNSVYPGEVRTPMMKQEAKDLGLTMEQYDEKMAKLHPIGWVGEPIDIAYADLYLASDESRWVIGSELVVDGGFVLKDVIEA